MNTEKNIILHSDGLIELKYNVASDILRVRWPASKGSSEQELNYSFQRLLDCIIYYDVKKLLIIAQDDVEQVSDEAYKSMNTALAKALVNTRLQKIARLGSNNKERETIVLKIAGNMTEQTGSSIIFKAFVDENEAVKWLQQV